jgi:hypothetical protein
MRPGHLRVFDGLRITTEHVEHLQGALHSAIQDIRGILGLGRVHEGLRAVVQQPDAILVEPGFAFDLEGNRIACDEPQTIEVSFAAAQETLFLCVEYQQVPTDEVEGKPVQIWDSCSLLLRPDLPAAADNQIPIARLQKRSDNEAGFDLHGVFAPDERPAPPEPADRVQPLPTDGPLTQPQPVAISLPFTGVIELSGHFDDDLLARTANAAASPSAGAKQIILSENALALPPKCRSASFHSSVTGRLKLTATEPAETEQEVLVQVSAHAETEVAPELQTRCVGSIQLSAGQLNDQKTQFASDAAEHAIVQFRFTHLQSALGAGIDGELLTRLSQVMLRIELHRDNDGFKLISCCSGPDGLPSPHFSFDWTGHLIWKAFVA